MRWRQSLAGLSVVGFSCAAVWVAPAAALADAVPQINSSNPPSLGGWTVTADANTVDILVDSPAGLAGEHPIDEFDLPEDYTDFETGPFGLGRATLVYPGSVVANFGSASQQLNMGIPSQLEPIVGSLNDPVIASSAYPGGPASATWPSNNPTQGKVGEMTTSAGDNGETATSALADTNLNGLLSVGGLKGNSSSVAGSTATATATTSVGDIQILGGLIEVKGLSSTATATSNGTTASGSGEVSPVSVSIAGYRVGVGSQGLQLGPAPTVPLGGLVSPTAALKQLVAALGLKVTPLGVTKSVAGGQAQVTAGGVQISFTLPAAPGQLNSALYSVLSQLPSQLALLATLPQVFQQGTFTITLGRATAAAEASPPFSFNLPPGFGNPAPATPSPALTTGTFDTASPSTGAGAGLAVPSSGATGGGLGSSGETGGTPSTTPAVTPPTPAAAGAPPATASPTTERAGATPPPSLFSAVPISLSSPVGAGIVAGLLAAAGVVAYGLRRLAGLLSAAPGGGACPHEEEPS